MNPRIMPCILIVIELAASVVWAVNHDWRKAAYWFSAACINASVTF